MPIDPESKFGSILKKKVNNHIYSKTYTRSSYLLLKGAKGYQAYIMTIVGDSSYIKGDPTKLANNTYRQHDADFSGLVLYFTPKGKYLNGYAYKNGQPVLPASQAQSAPGKTKVQLVLQCTDWYEDVYVNNVLVMSVYLYTTCAGVTPDDPNSSGSPAPPNRCDPAPQLPTNPNPPTGPTTPTGPIIPMGLPGGHLTVNNVPGGGGFLPPTNEDDPCPEQPKIINNVKDPCLKKMVDSAIQKDVNFNIKESMNSIFNQNTDFNIDYIDAPPQDFKDPTTDGDTGVDNFRFKKNPDGTPSHELDFMNLTIRLNTTLSNASKEYITATIMHEALHAYLNYSKTIVNQHLDMARNYLNSMATQLQALYPNMSAIDAKALAWGGLEKEAGSLYSNLSQLEKENISNTNKAYKNGTNGIPCNR